MIQNLCHYKGYNNGNLRMAFRDFIYLKLAAQIYFPYNLLFIWHLSNLTLWESHKL